MRKIIFITIPAILIFLIALELGLRVCGYLYAQRHNPAAHVRAKESGKDGLRILCLGDSFTVGVGADSESSYPRQLEKILQKNISEKISVINGGCLANTSSLLLKNLQADIDKYSPSIIVIMIGISNSWNLEDSSYFVINGNAGFLNQLEKWLSTLSVYKLLRIGLEDHKLKMAANPQKHDDNGLNRKTDPRIIELRGAGQSFLRDGKNDLAVEKAKEALKIDNTDYTAHLLLAQALIARGEYQPAKEELWRAIDLVKEWDANLIYGISHLLKAADPDDDLVLFKEYFQAKVEKNKRDAFIKMIEASSELYENEKIFKRVLDYDLQQIVRLAAQKGMPLVLLTYPSGGMMNLNGVITEASRKYNVLLIDNEVTFEGKPRSELFVADGHCNEKGYGLIAENVYAALAEKGMLSKGGGGSF